MAREWVLMADGVAGDEVMAHSPHIGTRKIRIHRDAPIGEILVSDDEVSTRPFTAEEEHRMAMGTWATWGTWWGFSADEVRAQLDRIAALPVGTPVSDLMRFPREEAKVHAD